MPNWKFPCAECKGPVKTNQKGIECGVCNVWVHFRCTELTEVQYEYLENNVEAPFYCLGCMPRPLYADMLFESTASLNVENSVNVITSHLDSNISLNESFSSAHSSDFEYIDMESDSESRGLNFDSLPVQNNSLTITKKKHPITKHSSIPVRTVTYKYPCLICNSPCKERVQDSMHIMYLV